MSHRKPRARHSLRIVTGLFWARGPERSFFRRSKSRRTGAIVLAEIVGYGLTSDAFHLAAPDPKARAQQRRWRRLWRIPGRAQALSWISAHGTATQLGDLAETRAIKQVFGSARRVAAHQCHEGEMGHVMGAAGRFSVLAA